MNQKELFPVFLDLREKSVLIVTEETGRAEGLVRMLGDYTGRLTLVVPAAGETLAAFAKAGKAKIRQKSYEREDIYGADLVIASGLNEKAGNDLFAACRCMGIPVNIENDRMRSDFLLPSEEMLRSITARSVQVSPQPETDTAADAADAGSPGSTEEGSKKERLQVEIYTDGAARGNPDGPGGYAAVIEFRDRNGTLHTREIYGAYEKTTNNRMELLAAAAGLEALTKPCDVTLYSDSKYLTDAFSKGWVENWIRKDWKRADGGAVKNIPLWKRLLRAREPHNVRFEWVKGHAGHPQNERCDELATRAADNGPWQQDDLDKEEKTC